MRPARTSGVMAIAAMLLIVASSGVGLAQTRPRTTTARTPVATVGLVIGSAWKSESLPYPDARLRLRDVETGRAVARTIGDANGRFRFENCEPGIYVVELLSIADKVLAVGDLFGVAAGSQATTIVRLGSQAPWFAGFFGNAAAAAIAAASTLGVTAVGSNGSPTSAQ